MNEQWWILSLNVSISRSKVRYGFFCFSLIYSPDVFDAVWSTTAEYWNMYFLLTLHANRVLFLGLLSLMRSFWMKVGNNVYDWGRRRDCEEVVALADTDHGRPHLRRLHGRDWDLNPFGGIEKSSAWTAANERLIFKASQGRLTTFEATLNAPV